MAHSNSTLAQRFWPITQDSSLLRNVSLTVLGSAVVALAAHVSVPMLPVPMTLQTLAVLGVGACFGSRLGAATLALYAAEGAIGLPVFAPTPDGYPGLFGPTGGYILGFILAAALVGWFSERNWDRNVLKMMAATLLGAAVIYVPGLLWLSTFTGIDKALTFGLAPFWLGDVVKAAIVALGLPSIWSLISKKA